MQLHGNAGASIFLSDRIGKSDRKVSRFRLFRGSAGGLRSDSIGVSVAEIWNFDWGKLRIG
jgi:hypothetical protein